MMKSQIFIDENLKRQMCSARIDQFLNRHFSEESDEQQPQRGVCFGKTQETARGTSQLFKTLKIIEIS